MSPAQKRMRKPAPAPAKSNIPRRTHSAGKQSSLSFYLRDSAEGFPFPAVRLTPSVPVSGLLQSHIHSRSPPVLGRLRVLLLRQTTVVSPGISFAVIQFWYYLTTPGPACQPCISTKCPQSEDEHSLSTDRNKSRRKGISLPPALSQSSRTEITPAVERISL